MRANRPVRAAGPTSRRWGPRLIRPAVALPLAVLLGAAPAARAEDLLAALVAAAKLIPAADEGLHVCLPVEGLENVRGVSLTVDAPPHGSDPHRVYTAASRGAYIGDGAPGVPAPPFPQALLDARAVERLELKWRERRIGVYTGVPVLRDTGSTPGAPAPTKPPPDTIIDGRGESYVGPGADAALFVHSDNDWLAPVPPKIVKRNDPRGTAATMDAAVPPGLWNATRLCYVLQPDRVLEYGDPIALRNGIRRITAAVLFHPSHVPSWIADPRVVAAMPRHMIPDDVRFVTFRDDGDGWRPETYPFAEVTVGRIHVVAAGSP